MRLSKPVAFAALLGLALPTLLSAQSVSAPSQPSQPAATLTLDEAISLARRNNPIFLQTANARKTADAQVRSAYGALLPSSSASFSSSYTQGGTQQFSGLSFQQSSDVYQSSYSIGLNYQINSATLIAPRAAKASRDAAEADVTGASETLRSGVTQQYITALRAEATAALQDTLVETSRGQLDLAKARVAVGAANILDVRRAEVTLGQAQVAALTAHNTAAVEKLHLFQQMGVAPPGSVALTTKFALSTPTFSLDSVLDLARRANPAVLALRERENASGWNVRMAQSQYTPTLSLRTGLGGQAFQYSDPSFLISQAQNSAISQRADCFTQDSVRSRIGMPTNGNCSAIQFSPTTEQQIRSSNNQFPFNFTKQPLSVSASLSIPVFDGFSREQRVEQAQIDRDNARLNLRARELQLTADVTQAYLNLVTAARTVELQEVNAGKAREELTYAQERYRVGAATFLDVTTANGTFAQAQVDRVNAIYDYHRSFAALEAAIGRPLR